MQVTMVYTKLKVLTNQHIETTVTNQLPSYIHDTLIKYFNNNFT